MEEGMALKKGTLHQILLITDGCSNQGEDPAAMAALAREQGITVNVIGVLDQFETENGRGLREVEEIARAGGGISRIVETRQLAETVRTVTRQAMTQTITGVVNRELREILGGPDRVEDLPPDTRGHVMEVVDELGETADLNVCLLIDTSASMGTKLPTVREALIDLSMSLMARIGSNRFCLYVFPGKREAARKTIAWTADLGDIGQLFNKIGTHGVTPTGPAIREAIKSFSNLGRRQIVDSDEYDDRPG
jgi:Ca-activated chloride channel family protein